MRLEAPGDSQQKRVKGLGQLLLGADVQTDRDVAICARLPEARVIPPLSSIPGLNSAALGGTRGGTRAALRSAPKPRLEVAGLPQRRAEWGPWQGAPCLRPSPRNSRRAPPPPRGPCQLAGGTKSCSPTRFRLCP